MALYDNHDVGNLCGVELLANEIVKQAIEDWKLLYNGSSQTGLRNYKDLIAFFNSDWCELLLTGTNLDGKVILKQLETNYPQQERSFANEC